MAGLKSRPFKALWDLWSRPSRRYGICGPVPQSVEKGRL